MLVGLETKSTTEKLEASQSQNININGATSGFEMCFDRSTFGENTSRIQLKRSLNPTLCLMVFFKAVHDSYMMRNGCDAKKVVRDATRDGKEPVDHWAEGRRVRFNGQHEHEHGHADTVAGASAQGVADMLGSLKGKSTRDKFEAVHDGATRTHEYGFGTDEHATRDKHNSRSEF